LVFDSYKKWAMEENNRRLPAKVWQRFGELWQFGNEKLELKIWFTVLKKGNYFTKIKEVFSVKLKMFSVLLLFLYCYNAKIVRYSFQLKWWILNLSQILFIMSWIWTPINKKKMEREKERKNTVQQSYL